MKDAPNDIARFYYVGLAGAKKRAMLYVEECGITNDQIFALAMQMRGAGLLLIDRMDNNRENPSRILRKEIERRAAVNDNSPNRLSHGNDYPFFEEWQQRRADKKRLARMRAHHATGRRWEVTKGQWIDE
jgi:hypothetical protein